MTKTDLVAKMGEHNAFVPGKRIKLDFGGSEGAIMLDGVANAVTEEALTKGEIDAMTAFMQGKLKVEGDMSNAMQLQGVLAKLKS